MVIYTISSYYNLDAIPTSEGKAQLVGEFTELYMYFCLSLLHDDKREILKQQARILHNSGYSSLAISTIRATIR
jgi:hypothetical protein